MFFSCKKLRLFRQSSCNCVNEFIFQCRCTNVKITIITWNAKKVYLNFFSWVHFKTTQKVNFFNSFEDASKYSWYNFQCIYIHIYSIKMLYYKCTLTKTFIIWQSYRHINYKKFSFSESSLTDYQTKNKMNVVHKNIQF